MKKIVISTLLMGLVGIASAQTVSLGGTIRYDVVDADGAATTAGVSKSEITFRATEEIGKGIKVTAGLGLNGAGRGETVEGTDAFVAVATPVGELMVGQVEVANGIIGNSQDLAPVIGSEGVVLAATENKDVVKYTSPAVAGFKASLSATRALGANGASSSADYAYTVGVAGAVGPVTGKVDYTDGTERIRVSGSVNVMGVAVGAGWSGNEKNVKNSWSVGAAMPVGPLTVGAAYSEGNGKAKEVGAQYNLSKRTSVGVAYQDITENTVAANNISTTRVRLQHTF